MFSLRWCSAPSDAFLSESRCCVLALIQNKLSVFSRSVSILSWFRKKGAKNQTYFGLKAGQLLHNGQKSLISLFLRPVPTVFSYLRGKCEICIKRWSRIGHGPKITSSPLGTRNFLSWKTQPHRRRCFWQNEVRRSCFWWKPWSPWAPFRKESTVYLVVGDGVEGLRDLVRVR